MDMQKIFDGFLVLITAVAVIMIGTWVWYTVSDKQLFTNSVSTYVTSVTDKLTGQEYSPLSANYYENYNGSGKEVVEFQINAYSDQHMNTIYSRGLQLIIDEENGNELYYVDTYAGMSWNSMHKYDSLTDDGKLKEFYYLEIDGELCAVRMDGTRQDHVKKLNAGRTAGLLLGGWIYVAFGGDYNPYDVTLEEYEYTWEDFMLAIKDMILSCSYGTGTYTMPLVDFGDFWHVYEVYDDGSASDTPLGGDSTEILINSYFTADIHYSRGGMTYAQQSMFGSVAGDSNYNVTGVEFDVNYYKANVVYNLTEQDFVSRYSQVDLGYYYALSSDFISELKKYDNLEINIVFDISNINYVNVLGLDYYALNGIKVNSLTILSDTDCSINILPGALSDTGLTEIIVSNVTINDLSNSGVIVHEMV